MAHEGLYGVRGKKISRGSALSIVFAIGILIAATLIFNYFNFIPLSKMFPGVFGFLPHQNTVNEEQKTQKVAYEDQQLLFVCPVAKDLCTSGVILYDLTTQSFNGFGYSNLPEGTKVVSPFAGNATVEKTGEEGEEVVTITIISSDNLYKAIYTFQGETKLSGSSIIGQGDNLGSVGHKAIQIVSFTEQPYILYSVIQDNKSGVSLPLKPSFDGLGLTFEQPSI